METFWALWAPFGPFGASFGGNGKRNEALKGAQERIYGCHENVDFPLFFLAFWRSGPSHGAPNGRLETLLGATWHPLGDIWQTFWHVFACIEFCIKFGSVWRRGRRQRLG